MHQIPTLDALDLKRKRVLLRVDLNVPLEEGKILDETRLVESLPTIRYILERGGQPILISHLGRPDGASKSSFSLRPVARRLEELLEKRVRFFEGPLEEAGAPFKPDELFLLENIRFQKGEERPEEDPSLLPRLRALGELYVNDAFASCHRPHTSIVPLARAFPRRRAAGLLLQKEIEKTLGLLKSPKRPFFALIGGSKISTKLGLLRSLLDSVDALFLGGGMVYTFFLARGLSIGGSIREEGMVEEARQVLAEAERRGVPLFFPVDLVVTENPREPKEILTVEVRDGIPKGFEGVDIGPKSLALYGQALKEAETLLWNGPFGIYEVPPFDKGSRALAHLLASLEGQVVVGGGDSVALVKQALLGDQMAHLSTGGGATLELLEGGTLPGIEALKERETPGDSSF